jgi:UDP-glucose:glycoprotein glucosyltransferase
VERETIALENEDAFFPTLDALTHPETFPRVSHSSTTTPEAAYEFSLAAVTASGLISDPAPVAAALALHAAAPRIEAFYAHYRDTHGTRIDLAGKPGCESWVDWYGALVCDLENLRRLLGHEALDPANDTGTAVPPTFVIPHLIPHSTLNYHLLSGHAIVLNY